MAGFELDPVSLRIRRIIFSPDGDLGPQALTRPLANIQNARGARVIELNANVEVAPMPAVRDVILLSRATRFRRDAREAGRLIGVTASPDDGTLTIAFGRAHWWSPRFAVAAADADLSTPGEIRMRAAGTTRAA